MGLFYPLPYSQNIHIDNSGDRPKHDPPQPYAHTIVLCMPQRSGSIFAKCDFTGALSRGHMISRTSNLDM